MTVQRGREWGETVPMPDDAVAIGSDAELAAAIAGGERRPLLLRGGDLFTTLGAPRSTTTVRRVPIDVLKVSAGGDDVTAVAHVVARRRGRRGWWRGPILCVMNVEHIGRADVAPRAHPNDGRFDIVSVRASMSIRARWQAWRRLATGTHVPHPAIDVRRATAEHVEFDEPVHLWIDGVERGPVRSLSISVTPDAAVIHM